MSTKVCTNSDAKLKSGHYEGLVSKPDSAPTCLMSWPKLKKSTRQEPQQETVDGEYGRQINRLDLNALIEHHRRHGQEQTFLSRDCKHMLDCGRTAVKVYAIPKYTMRFTTEKPQDMESVISLALAKTTADIHRACASTETKTYHLGRHQYLRRVYVTCFLLENGEVVDYHKHWIEAGGHSEHAMFVLGLQPGAEFSLEKFALGPKNSRPGPAKHPVAPKRSVALKSKLAPPVHQSPIDLDGSPQQQQPQQQQQQPGATEASTTASSSVVAVCNPNASESSAPTLQASKCLARTWADGIGAQCKVPRRQGTDFCGAHRDHANRKHGRIDEDPPHFMPKARRISKASNIADTETIEACPLTGGEQGPSKFSHMMNPTGNTNREYQ